MTKRDFMEPWEYERYKQGYPIPQELPVVYNTVFNPSKHKIPKGISQNAQIKIRFMVMIFAVIAVVAYFFFLYPSQPTKDLIIDDVLYEFGFAYNDASETITFLLYIHNTSDKDKSLDCIQSFTFFTANKQKKRNFTKEMEIEPHSMLPAGTNKSYHIKVKENLLSHFCYIGVDLKIEDNTGSIKDTNLMYAKNKSSITNKKNYIVQKYSGLKYTFDYHYMPELDTIKLRLHILNMLNEPRKIIPTSYLNFFVSKKITGSNQYFTKNNDAILLPKQLVIDEHEKREFTADFKLAELGNFDALGVTLTVVGNNVDISPQKQIILSNYITPQEIKNKVLHAMTVHRNEDKKSIK